MNPKHAADANEHGDPNTHFTHTHTHHTCKYTYIHTHTHTPHRNPLTYNYTETHAHPTREYWRVGGPLLL